MDKQAENALKSKNIRKNYIFNVLYQVLLLIVPFITTPYVSRILAPEGIGQYSFTNSIITYFTLFAALGFGIYAQRTIAQCGDNKVERTRNFWEIFFCRIFSVLICLAVNIGVCFSGIYKGYSTLMWILNCNILAVALDVSYLFQGVEEFGKIVIRNTIIKIINVVLIFILVKESGDVWKYVLINSAMAVIGNLFLWIGTPKYLTKIKFRELKVFRHLPKTIKLFIPTIVISIYTVLDKTLIGLITNSDAENGFYEQAEKIVKIALTVLTCLNTVMIPRNSSEISKGNYEIVKTNIYSACRFVWFLGIPLVFGLCAVTFNFNEWFFGEGYSSVNKITIVLSLLILAIGFSGVLGQQYLIPMGKEKVLTLTVLAGAIINFILNIILIYFFGALGAAISSIIAETAVSVIQLIYLRKEFKISKILFCGVKNIIAGAVMFAVIYPMSIFLPSKIYFTLIIIFTGIIVYFLSLFILRDKFFIQNLSLIKINFLLTKM